MADDERRKMRQLMREKEEKNGEDKVNFLYKSSKVDGEEFLLGRKINNFEDFEETRFEDKPEPIGSIFEDPIAAGRAHIDMETKMREDPLFAIRKKQDDARREILRNPIKMKKLQRQVDVMKQEKKKEKKRKKKKKKSDGDDDSDEDILTKYLEIVEKKYKQSKSSEKTTENSVKTGRHGNDGRTRRRSRSPSPRKRSSSPRRRPKSRSPKKRSRSRSPRRRPESRSPQRRSRSRSPRRRPESRSSKRQSRSRSPRRRSRSRSLAVRARSNHKHSKSPPHQQQQQQQQQSSQKLTSSDKQRKLQEMMDNAKQRNTERELNVKSYKKEDDKLVVPPTGVKEDFVNPMLANHVTMSSVENRIKRNIYNIQRTNAELEKNFARK
ncbi:uncharacterized protein LOC141900084 [Tubulanus polymorphus]|uniref:uncharacterized protein LOC141900084 n=1 Tax=Tubulanus polymorphus TaxID=672921 RepID=UPI003DA4CBCD